jgi:hypothetical protein
MSIRKLVVVSDAGFISELKATGPIKNPARIPVDTIKKMLVNGRSIYECDPADPANTKKRVKLTMQNVGKANFAGAKPAAAPVKEETNATTETSNPEVQESKEAAPTDETTVNETVEQISVDEPADEAPLTVEAVNAEETDDASPEETTQAASQDSYGKKNKKKHK